MEGRKGFTLPEVVVAIVVMAIAFVSVFTALTASANYFRRSMELRTASLILQEEVSNVRDLKFSDILGLGPNFTLGSMASLKNCTGTIQKGLFEGKSDILKLTFRTDWQSFDGTAKTKQVVTLMTDQGINKK